MNLHLGLRALAVLALVAAATAVIVRSELIGGATGAHAPALNTLFVVGQA